MWSRRKKGRREMMNRTHWVTSYIPCCSSPSIYVNDAFIRKDAYLGKHQYHRKKSVKRAVILPGHGRGKCLNRIYHDDPGL
jgi:hypothetical protein